MSNPLANESGFEKIKNSLKGKKKEEEVRTGHVESALVGMNKAIDIVSEACACCWDKEIPDTYEGRADYVGRRTKTGHTSILEHSNFVTYFRVAETYTEDLINFLSWNRFLHHKLYKGTDGDWRMLLGGSYRGYSDLYLNTDDLNNAVLKAVTSILYMYAPSAAFEDICAYGLMDKTRFYDAEPDDENINIFTTYKDDPEANEKLFTIVGLDDVKKLYTGLYTVDKEFAESLNTGDLLEFITVTVLFKDMSRVITQQLCRHRNAITQESQRYVDYSNSAFNSPVLFRPDKYDPNHKYNVRFGPSSILSMTLEEIGQAMCNIYGMLNNPVLTGKEHALLREDARAFLPGNTVCRKIYMTFTYRMLFKFLQLREARGAQAEIRMYAAALGDWIRSHTAFCTKEILDTYTLPKLLIEDPFKIDVDEGEEETVTELTEDDYIRAAGLNNESDN